MASALVPLFNVHVQSLPAESIQQKRDIASWCNRELHELNLAIRCPRTNKPAILVADTRYDGDIKGRFRLSVRDEGGHLIRSGSWSDVPTLELIQASPRLEPFAKRGDSRPRGR
jgi:hypothetical protein